MPLGSARFIESLDRGNYSLNRTVADIIADESRVNLALLKPPESSRLEPCDVSGVSATNNMMSEQEFCEGETKF